MAEPKVPLTLVIPTFNEERRLPATLQILSDWIPKSCFDVEVIIVDDGSTDQTREVAEEYSSKIFNLRFMSVPHIGYMNAIITGLSASKRPLRATLEADCPIHPQMLEEFANNYPDFDIVMGSRVSNHDAASVKGKPPLRQLVSWLMSQSFTILFKGNIRDPQIGFKLYRAKVIDHILPLLTLPHDGLKSTELVVKALAFGYRVKEVPVHYQHDDDSRCVPKGNYSVVIKAGMALLQLWVQSYVDFRRNQLPTCPIRFGFLLKPFWRFIPFLERAGTHSVPQSIKAATP
jgi:dolichyl-phosphate beta-glucosyltransferase